MSDPAFLAESIRWFPAPLAILVLAAHWRALSGVHILTRSKVRPHPVTLPTIEASRLVLRPFEGGDASQVQRLAGTWDIADTTLNIPHPYEDGVAEQWIAGHKSEYEAGTRVVFAIVPRDGLQLIGAIGLTVDRDAGKGELGYWIGKPFWGQGYCTEAAGAVLDYGFGTLGLNRICARHFARNPASGRVMQKLGMTVEGTARQDTIKWGRYEDLVLYGILRSEWSARLNEQRLDDPA